MQIYELLKNDHQKVKQLMEQLVKLSPDAEIQRHDLIEQIRDELIPHSRAEEAVFYNTLRTLDGAKDEAMHGYQEHMEAETLLRTLQFKDKIDADWTKTARKLKETLEHHVAEEESRIFATAKRYLSDHEAEMIGAAFERLKPEVKQEGIMGTTLDMVVNMMPPRFTSSFRKSHLAPRA